MQGHDAEQGHRELHNNEDALDGPEFAVHGEMIDHKVGEPGEVAAEGQQCGKHCHGQQRPLGGAAHDDAAQQKQRADDGAHIDGAVGALRVVEILRQIGEQLPYRLSLILRGPGQSVEAHVHHGAAFRAGCGSTLDVGHEQRHAFGAAIAPAHDLVVGHAPGGPSLSGGLAAGQRCELALAALCFLGVFVRVVQARGVGSDGEHAGCQNGGCGFAPLRQLPLAPCLTERGDSQRGHHEGEVIAHLRVVGLKLQHGE